MDKIFTIGFTKKSAQYFFELLKENDVDIVVDVRLNNTSQLSGFSKYPDIQYFLKKIANIEYISDLKFAPTDQILRDYKTKKINWNEYVEKFEKLMKERVIEQHIKKEYSDKKGNICILCSEEKSIHCHRSLVAKIFSEIGGTVIVNL